MAVIYLPGDENGTVNMVKYTVGQFFLKYFFFLEATLKFKEITEKKMFFPSPYFNECVGYQF